MKPLCQLLAIAIVASLPFHLSAATFYVDANGSNPTPPYANWSTAATNIQDAIDASSNGDLILVTNGVYSSTGRISSDGSTNCLVVTNAITIQSINGAGVTRVNGGGTMRCAYLTNGSIIGFTLTNGNAGAGGGVSGGTVMNCSIVGNHGDGAYLATLTNCWIAGNVGVGNYGGGAYKSTLNNCQLSNNVATLYGGGAAYCTLNNCLLTGNVAGTGGEGGGAYQCTLNYCVLTGNTAPAGGGAGVCTLNNCLVNGNTAYNHYQGSYATSWGGGVDISTANNCTIVNNTAVQPPTYSHTGAYGGGADESTLNNCIVQFNSESPPYYVYNQNYYNYYLGTLSNCCTAPLSGGSGNFSNDPLFVNSGAGDYHLNTNSPCINAGNNAYSPGTIDLDGNPRIAGGTVDIGAYEFQSPSSRLSYAWAQQYGIPTDGSADYADLDGTGFNVYQDWIAGLNPTNPASVLQMYSPPATNNSSGITISWQSVNTRTYYLQRSTNLSLQPSFTSIQSNILGQAGTTSYTDNSATNSNSYFYRVGVQ